MIESKVVVHITDAAQEQAYLDRSDPGAVDAVELGGVRTLLFVPMLKGGRTCWRVRGVSPRSPPLYRQTDSSRR
jgi:hypothetical protein